MNTRQSSRRSSNSAGSKGQALILIAVAFVALVAIVGLAVDLGRIFIALGQLRRAVDAASLAAASQFREGRTITEMTSMADQVMNLNGVDPINVVVEDCPNAINPGDPALCVTPIRKYVRVTATAGVPMSFLTVIGYNSITISSNSIAEAASIDVVLLIDISESMTYDAVAGDPLRDPNQCNPGHQCQPFEKVRAAASRFVQRILDLPPDQESDRLAFVTFSNGWQAGDMGTQIQPPGWLSTNAEAQAIVANLQVYNPPDCSGNPPFGLCRSYDPNGTFLGINCPVFDNGNDPSSCTTTNIGGALRWAGKLLGDPDTTRPDALWVVIVLTDGAANASNRDATHDYGYCPQADWDNPYCRDRLSYTRHYTMTEPLLYDADDYARDNSDFVGCYSPDPAAACSMPGQGAVIFTIGMGNQVLSTYAPGDIPHGVALLRYAAAVGDDGDPATDLCANLNHNETEWRTWCGNYYFDATGNDLDRVFEDIASRIFTRITH